MSDQPVAAATAEQLLAGLRRQIQRLHRHSGEPSTRDIAARTDRALSHTTVAAVLRCQRRPRWGQLELVVEALGGNPEDYRPLWIDIRYAEDRAAEQAAVPPQREALPGELKVLKDHATLRYDGGVYVLNQKRLLRNVGHDKVNGYLVRVHVDRFPHFGRLSELYHLRHPLVSEDLALVAWRGRHREVPLVSIRHTVTSSVIERWLRFAEVNGGAGGSAGGGEAAALAPGEETWIEYEYRVGHDRWGNWFQRAIRHGTDEVRVTVDFPAGALAPGGVRVMRSSPTEEPGRFRDAPVDLVAADAGDRRSYTWELRTPGLHDRYRTEWTFAESPTHRLAQAGVVQHRDDDPTLTTPAAPVDMGSPASVARAAEVADRLVAVADAVGSAHRFTGGMGLAAPQVGADVQVVLLRNVGSPQEILVNPVVERASGEDRDTEGCLSFFDVRGEVPRPTYLEVVYRTLDGGRRRRTYTGRDARDVAHELDHLQGTLYVDRMSNGDPVTFAPTLRKP